MDIYRVPEKRPRSSPPDDLLASASPAALGVDISIEKQIEFYEHCVRTAAFPCTARVMAFTPELSQWALINRSIANRITRRVKIAYYAQMMKEGKWMMTGETLSVERDTGMILNGYHRLKACIASGVPFLALVVFGIDREAFRVIDTGAGRTCADAYRVAGIPHPGLASMATRWISIYQSGNRYNRSKRWENVESLEYYETLDQEIFQHLLPACQEVADGFNKLLPAGQLLAYLYVMSSSPRYDRIINLFVSQLREHRSSGKAIHLYLSSRREAGTRFNENMRTVVLDAAIEATYKRERLSQQALAEAVAGLAVKQEEDTP